MKKMAKLLKTIGFVLFIILAAMGVGMVPLHFNKRERDFDGEINIEQRDEKEEEDEVDFRQLKS